MKVESCTRVNTRYTCSLTDKTHDDQTLDINWAPLSEVSHGTTEIPSHASRAKHQYLDFHGRTEAYLDDSETWSIEPPDRQSRSCSRGMPCMLLMIPRATAVPTTWLSLHRDQASTSCQSRGRPDHHLGCNKATCVAEHQTIRIRIKLVSIADRRVQCAINHQQHCLIVAGFFKHGWLSKFLSVPLGNEHSSASQSEPLPTRGLKRACFYATGESRNTDTNKNSTTQAFCETFVSVVLGTVYSLDWFLTPGLQNEVTCCETDFGTVHESISIVLDETLLLK